MDYPALIYFISHDMAEVLHIDTVGRFSNRARDLEADTTGIDLRNVRFMVANL